MLYLALLYTIFLNYSITYTETIDAAEQSQAVRWERGVTFVCGLDRSGNGTEEQDGVKAWEWGWCGKWEWCRWGMRMVGWMGDEDGG